MDLKGILADKVQFPDNHVIQVNGQQYTIGMLRGLTAEQQTVITAKEAELTTKALALERAQDELRAAQRTTADTYAQAQRNLEDAKALAAAGKQKEEVDPFLALENDNILGPVVKYNKALKAELEAQRAVTAQVAEGIKRMTESYLTDRLTDAYQSVVPADKQDKYTLESLIKDGMAKGYKTQAGYVDIKRTWQDVAAPDVLATKVKEADDAGYKRAMAEMQAKGILVTAPTSGGAGLPGVPFASQREPSSFKSLDEAFAAAAKDAEVWRDFNGISGN